MKREIIIATRNKKKLKEIKRLFKNVNTRVSSLDKFPNVPEVVEDGKTFEANAIKKALVVSGITNKLVLADDSGLEVAAINGKPGVHSARYAGPKKDDRSNNLKLLKALKGKSPAKRAAQFTCVIAVADGGKLIKVIKGVCKGSIAFSMAGETGFGYDPVFMPKGYKRSFASLGSNVKDRLSHRAKALKKAKRFIEEYLLKDF